MKNIVKIAGIIVMAAVIGFSFATCGNGSTGGGSYNGYFIMMQNSNYEAVFTGETAPASFKTLSGTKDDLIVKVESAYNYGGQMKFGPHSYAEVGGDFDIYVTGGTSITAADKTTLMNELKNKGYVVGVKDGGAFVNNTPGYTLVWGVFSE